MLPLRTLRSATVQPLLRRHAAPRALAAVGTHPGSRQLVKRFAATVPPPPPPPADAAASASTPAPASIPPPAEAPAAAPAPPPKIEEEELPVPEREHASVYIANVFPIMLGSWDMRTRVAQLREETLMEQLGVIMDELRGRHAFKVESWEVARKDGGVFCHFSYMPPRAEDLPRGQPETAIHTPEDLVPDPTSAASIFLPLFLEAARKHGGWPHWAGAWWASCIDQGFKTAGRTTDEAGHHLYRGDLRAPTPVNASKEPAAITLQGWQRIAGRGRVWIVRGRQWTEDLNRFPSSRLRVEFDGPDVSQEMLYRLFRPYGRLTEIVPPSPVPAGALRFAMLSFSRISTTVAANNCMHGFLSPTKTADYDLQRAAYAGGNESQQGSSSSDSGSKIPMSRLRLYYERPLKAHYVRTWMSDHPRIVLPVIAFLVATLSYTFFDPIRAFFIRSHVEGMFNLEQYSAVKFLRDNVWLPLSKVVGSRKAKHRRNVDDLGRASWRDRLEAERNVERWLSEFPSTFVVITGPPGSGKHDLVNRIIQDEKKPALVIDCTELQKAKTDGALVKAVADETGYWPVFSFLQSMNGLIDLASVGLIGQKAGFSTPIDQQLRSMLDIASNALKDVSLHGQEHRKHAQEYAQNEIELAAAQAAEMQEIKLGIWHDGRLDCVAGNGIMSELGVGIEVPTANDISAPVAPLMGNNAPIDGEGVPPTSTDAFDSITKAVEKAARADGAAEDDVEASVIKTLPIVVLRNFALKPARGDVWTVLAEWGASLVENKIAHVIVIGEGSVTTKTLTQALPSKPLNSISLSDADDRNSLEFVREKLSTPDAPFELSAADKENIAKLGGRMVDLELLVYKARSGQTITHAVDDIVRRNVVELRKAAFGDDSEDAKHLPWTRAQAWKIVSELAKKPETQYAKLLLDFPFKGQEAALKALEEHDLIAVQYIDGRASMVRPGKPVFRQAFAALVNDDVFRASTQIEYNNAAKAKLEALILSLEDELSKLREITQDGGKLGVSDSSWFGLTKGSAIHQRAKYLLAQMDEAMGKLQAADASNTLQKKVFADTAK